MVPRKTKESQIGKGFPLAQLTEYGARILATSRVKYLQSPTADCRNRAKFASSSRSGRVGFI